MSMNEACRSRVEAAAGAGAEKAQCALSVTEKHAISFEGGDISLFRTTKDLNIQLSAIFDGRHGSLAANQEDTGTIDSEIRDLVASAASSPVDSACDIAPFRVAENLEDGVAGPEPEKMYDRVEEFLESVKKRYPEVTFRTAWLSFVREEKCLRNSNGLVVNSKAGRYELLVVFCSRKGGKTSTFNAFVGYSRDLNAPLLEWGRADSLLKESVEHTEAKPIDGKFTGDIIVSPECMGDFIRFVANYLRDGRIMSGSSEFKGKLGAVVAAPEFTLRSLPLSGELATGYFTTKDGFKANDIAIVEKGILRSLLLSQYAANKTGLPYSGNDGECYVVDAGGSELSGLVRNIKKGLLVTRVSGSDPNEKGDFSGVAKSSFYIEDGEIKFPVSETMISVNIPQMLLNIKGISRERINSGDSVCPWMAFSGVTISGR